MDRSNNLRQTRHGLRNDDLQQLRLADLGPTIGAGKGDHPGQGRAPLAGAARLQICSRALEREDMVPTFKGRHIIRPQACRWKTLSLRAVMENAQSSLRPDLWRGEARSNRR